MYSEYFKQQLWQNIQNVPFQRARRNIFRILVSLSCTYTLLSRVTQNKLYQVKREKLDPNYLGSGSQKIFNYLPLGGLDFCTPNADPLLITLSCGQQDENIQCLSSLDLLLQWESSQPGQHLIYSEPSLAAEKANCSLMQTHQACNESSSFFSLNKSFCCLISSLLLVGGTIFCTECLQYIENFNRSGKRFTANTSWHQLVYVLELCQQIRQISLQ